MKNVKKITGKFSLAAILSLLLLFAELAADAQVETIEKISFESEIDAKGTIAFVNRSFDTEITTWDNKSVEMVMAIKLKAKKQEDIDITLDAIRQIEFAGHSSRVWINTLFWTSQTCSGNHRLKLINGEKVVLKDFDVQISLRIPKTASIEIDCRYADVRMETIAGQAGIKLYNGKLYGESFGQALSLDLRYAKAFLANAPEVKMDLYDSDIDMASCGSLELKSKYGKIEIERCGSFNFDSYDDNISIGELTAVSGSAKYSDFDFGNSQSIRFDFYDSNLHGEATGSVKGKCKYSEIEITKASDIVLTSSHDDNFVFDEIFSLDCAESKYSDFEIAILISTFTLNSYDDNVTIAALDPEFLAITIDGKYGDYRLTMPEDAAYRLLVDMKYGNVDYPESAFDRKTYIKENSNLFMDATTKNRKADEKRLVEIKGHDNRVIIRN